MSWESVDVSCVGRKWATVLYRLDEQPRILMLTRWHKLAWWRLLLEERRIRREAEA